MAEIPYQQDLAPKGGYPEIKWARNLPKRGPSGLVIMLGGIATMAVGFYFVAKTNRERREIRKEQLTARLALLPLLQAEQDRRVLRAMTAFEEEEALIMKDVPGWKVGESVYNTDKWIPPLPCQLKDI